MEFLAIVRKRKGEIKTVADFSPKKKPDPLLKIGEGANVTAFGQSSVDKGKRARLRWPLKRVSGPVSKRFPSVEPTKEQSKKAMTELFPFGSRKASLEEFYKRVR